MKRYLILMTVATLLIACSNDADEVESGYMPSTDAIAFDATGDNETGTRAAGEINNMTALRATSFGVFACYTGKETYENATVSSDFMHNQRVTYATAWTYAPVKYWPNNADEYISFFAYAPYEATPKDDGRCITDMSKREDLGDPWINFHLPNKPWGTYNASSKKYENPEQIDLLYGVNSATNKPWFDQRKANNTVNQKMTFTFHHALVCVGDEITIRLSNDVSTLICLLYKIYIKKLTIDYTNLTTKGRLVLNSNTTPNWKEVISGEVTTTRTLELNYDEIAGDVSGDLFPDAVKPDLTSADDADRLTYYNANTGITATATTISTGKGLFYIPLQVKGMDAARADLTLEYQVINNIGEAYEGTATGSFPLDMNIDGKKQGIDITLTKDFKLGILVYTIGTVASEPSYVRQL